MYKQVVTLQKNVAGVGFKGVGAWMGNHFQSSEEVRSSEILCSMPSHAYEEGGFQLPPQRWAGLRPLALPFLDILVTGWALNT